jgi:dTDP-glucose 4,6-dehydratase
VPSDRLPCTSAGTNTTSAGSNTTSAGSNTTSAGTNTTSAGTNTTSAGTNTTSADTDTTSGGHGLELAGARVAVTGGAGFLGSHLCDALIAADAQVICLDNFSTGSDANVAHLFGHPRFQMVVHDVTTFMWVPGHLDAVLHLASPASPIDYLRLPIQTLKVGSLGTHNALGLAKAKRARFLLASTSEVYGDPQVHPQPESYWGHVNPIGPRGVYDEAKRFSEALAFAYHRTHGVAIRVPRIFNTYGPRMRMNDGRAVPTFISQALAGEELTVHGDGMQTRSLCYVDDLIEGILRLLVSDDTGPVNLGSDYEVTMRELAESIVAATGSTSTIRFVGRPEDDPQVRRPDPSRALSSLGWRATTPPEVGIPRTVAWYQQTGGARQQTGGARQQTGGARQQTGGARQQTGGGLSPDR